MLVDTLVLWCWGSQVWYILCVYAMFRVFLFRLCHNQWLMSLTHWGRVTHICVGNLTIIGPAWSAPTHYLNQFNAGILLSGPWGTNFSEILIGIQTFSFKKMHLKMSSAKWRPFCLGLNVLKGIPLLVRETVFIMPLVSTVLEIPTGPPVRGRQLWRRTGNFLLIFLWFYVYDLRFKAWGPTTFLTEFPTLRVNDFFFFLSF